MSISLRYLSPKVFAFAQHSLLGFVLLAASWAAAVGAETTEAQTTISNALVETRYAGTLEVYSHARTGNKLDGSYKILGSGGGYIIASLRDGVLEGLWEQSAYFVGKRALRQRAAAWGVFLLHLSRQPKKGSGL